MADSMRLYQTRADYEVSDPDYDKQSETGLSEPEGYLEAQ